MTLKRDNTRWFGRQIRFSYEKIYRTDCIHVVSEMVNPQGTDFKKIMFRTDMG